jgi:hypothetical protein
MKISGQIMMDSKIPNRCTCISKRSAVDEAIGGGSPLLYKRLRLLQKLEEFEEIRP